VRFLTLAALIFGCESATEECVPKDFAYPQDAQLAFQHLQAKGTHNSYHIETTNGAIVEWEYTHAPLGMQLATQGVRQLELDLFYQDGRDVLEVLHVPTLDPGSTCANFSDCVAEIANFSLNNPAHHPLLVLLEFKGLNEQAQAALDRADTVLQVVLGAEGLVLPSAVQGNHADLKTAIEQDGWPNLGELRGKTLFVLHESGSLRDLYTEKSTQDWWMFPDANGNADHSFAAVHTLNNPFDDFEAIQELVQANHLVRTRADSDLEEARDGDNSRLLSALASGAHFISTDFPVPTEGFDYWVQIPDGTPSRCNPLTAPAMCASEDVENPAWMGGCENAKP
jgi:hypothetical protein